MGVKGKVRGLLRILPNGEPSRGAIKLSAVNASLPTLVVVVSEAVVVIVIGNSNDSIPCFDYDNDYDNELLRRRYRGSGTCCRATTLTSPL